MWRKVWNVLCRQMQAVLKGNSIRGKQMRPYAIVTRLRNTHAS